MSVPTFEQFTADHRARGFDEFLVREWDAGVDLAPHTHKFDASLRVARGEVWIAIADAGKRRFGEGDTCFVPRDVPHTETYGSAGATLWVARANAPLLAQASAGPAVGTA